MTKHIPPGVLAAAAVAHGLKHKSGEPLDLILKKFDDHADGVKEMIAKTDGAVGELKAQMLEVEQKMARGAAGGGEPFVETWGQQFVKAAEAEIAAMVRDRNAKAAVQIKAVTTDAASGGALIVPHRDGPNMLPQQRLTIRALLPVINIASGAVEYADQLTRPAGAAPVAEGAAKPESGMTWELKTTTAKVIAYWIKASRQALEDAPQLQSIIDAEMRYGLALAEEAQILNGDGTGQNLDGLLSNATAFTDASGILAETTEPTRIDVIGAALYQVAMADYPANGIILHHADWFRLKMLKDSDGRYILGDPQSMTIPQLWGLPVIPTKAIAPDEFLVGDFRAAATLYDRWQPRVEVGYVNDDFTRNLVTILAEERVALAVKNGAALVTGSFSEALT